MNQLSLIQRLSGSVGLEPQKFYSAVKTVCGCQGATDEHFAVLLMTADKYQLNPTLRQLFLMPTKKGIEVVIPVDGWVPMLTKHGDYMAHEVVLHWAGEPLKSKCIAATCRIWTRSRQALGLGPFEHVEMMAECERETGPWKSHPTRMLGHKAVIQGTRRCFGIYVLDEDEARNIGEVPKVAESAFVLPTTKAIEVEPESEDVAGWKAVIGLARTEEALLKLHDEFEAVRDGRPERDIEQIEAAFADHLATIGA